MHFKLVFIDTLTCENFHAPPKRWLHCHSGGQEGKVIELEAKMLGKFFAMVAFGLEGLQVEVVDGDKLDPGWSLIDQQVLGQDVGTFQGKFGWSASSPRYEHMTNYILFYPFPDKCNILWQKKNHRDIISAHDCFNWYLTYGSMIESFTKLK